MADAQMDPTLLVALQVLPALSVFITGFASVRTHAHRDRAFARSDEIEAGLSRLVKSSERFADVAIRDVSREHERTLITQPSIADAVMINAFVFVVIFSLEGMATLRMGWEFTMVPSKLSLAFLGFCAILLTPIALLWIAYNDVKEIGKQLVARRVATLWGRAATAYCSLEAKKLEEARSLADMVIKDTPGEAWATRLRATVELALGEQGNPKAVEGAIAMLSRAMELRALHSNSGPPIPELKLRARAFELQGVLQLAIKDIAEALVEDPEDPDLWLHRGRLYERLAESEKDAHAAASRYQVSRYSYERASDVDVLGVEPLRAWAELELRTGHPDLAQTLAEQAQIREPQNPLIQDILDRAKKATASRPRQDPADGVGRPPSV
jgi:tetratricopeptide (TPR) repeat protein